MVDGLVDEAVFHEECLSQAGNSPTTYTARRTGPRRESGLFCRAQKRRVAGPIGAAAGRAARCAPRMLHAAAHAAHAARRRATPRSTMALTRSDEQRRGDGKE